MAMTQLNKNVSVVMAVFNGEAYLREAIDSILNQTLNNFEFIIINDCSTDTSGDIIKTYDDKRIVFLQNNVNIGLAASLNKGIAAASGKYIARMDADDVSLPNRLAKQVDYLDKHENVVVLGTSAEFIDILGEKICTYFPPTVDEIMRTVFPGSPFIHPSVIFRKAVFVEAGQYPAHMRYGGEDPILFGRMAKYGQIANLSEALIKYRLVPGAMSRKPAVFRAYLSGLINKEINGEHITSEELRKLFVLYKSAAPADALYDYHYEIAKLNLWCGKGNAANKIHLRSCLELRGMNLKLFLIYILSYIPGGVVRATYTKLKKRKYK